MPENPPRRYLMEREYAKDDDAREIARRGGRPERGEYVRWRRQRIRSEREDLALRERLLREEAEALRQRAGIREAHALEAMSPDDHLAELREGIAAGASERTTADRELAAEYEAEAQDIAQHLVDNRSPDEVYEEMRR